MNDDEGRIIRNATYLFAGSTIADIAAFLFRLIVARGFGPDGFGLFSLALMTLTITTSVSLFGLPDGIVTFVSRFRSEGKPNHVAGVLVSSFATAGVSSVVSAVGLWVLAPIIAVGFFETAELTPLIRTFSLGVPARVVVALTAAVCLGYERGGLQSVVKRILPKLGTFGGAAAIIFVDGSLHDIVAAYVVVLWFAAAIGVLVAAVSVRETPINGIELRTRNLLDFSIPLLFSGFVAFFLNWTDAALIGYFMDSGDVGVYQAAFILGTNIAIFNSVITTALYPNFGSLVAEENVETLQKRFVKGVRWIVIFSVAPSAYLVAFPKTSIGMLFGREFTSGTTALVILVVGQVLASALALSTNVLKVTKNSRFVFLTYTGALIVNLAINLWLIPTIGIAGAAIGTISARTAANAMHYGWIRHRFDVHMPVGSIGRIAAGAGVAVVLTFPFRSFITSAPLFSAHIGMFSLFYALSMIGLGLVSVREIKQFVVENVPSWG